MFGTQAIIGEKVVSVLRNRVTLPAFTNAEIGEEVQAQYVTQFNQETKTNIVHHLNIFSKLEFAKRMDEIQRVLQESYGAGRINHQQYHNYIRYFYGYLSFMPEEVDKQRRIHLEPRIITDLKINNRAFVVGVKKHLELYPSIESYTTTLKEVYYVCEESEIPYLIEGIITKPHMTFTDKVPFTSKYICVYKIPPIVLYNNLENGIYTIPSDEINITFLDSIMTPSKEIIYRKEPISFNML